MHFNMTRHEEIVHKIHYEWRLSQLILITGGSSVICKFRCGVWRLQHSNQRVEKLLEKTGWWLVQARHLRCCLRSPTLDQRSWELWQFILRLLSHVENIRENGFMKRIYYFNTVVINLIKSKSDTLLKYFVVVRYLDLLLENIFSSTLHKSGISRKHF